MAKLSFTCFGCKQKSSGLKYTFEGHPYCYECYQKLSKQLEQSTLEKQHLYQYIKKMYNVSELSEEIINMLDHELDSGKKIKGMEFTLHYYHDILGNSIVSVNRIFFILRDFYEEAKKYVIGVKKIQEINKNIDIRVKPHTIQIDVNKLDINKNRNKIKYKMEDL